MKSQVNALLHVTRGIFKDILAECPALEGGLSKDWKRLTLLCRTRDLTVFTLDLPHLESLLLRGFEEGRLTSEGPLSRVVSTEVRVPRLFSGLWLRIFDKDACLKREVDVNAVFFLRSLCKIGKRIQVDCSSDRVQAKVGEYHDIEHSLRKPTFGWQNDDYNQYPGGSSQDSKRDVPCGDCDHNGRSLHYHDLFLHSVPEGGQDEELDDDTEGKVGRINNSHMSVHLVQAVDYEYPALSDVTDLFHPRNREELMEKRKLDIRLLDKIQQVADLIISSFDPFDAVAFSGECEETGRGTGFKHGPGAVAEGLKNWEKSQFPNWPHKLETIFPFESCGTHAGSLVDKPPNHEVASRLICVPKTAKGPRLIAAEPTAHQYCQQLLLRFLFDQCRQHFGVHFIDFRDQSKSGAMVYQASLNRELATVDLSDASDRLSCWTVERMFRTNPSLLHALHAARTRYIRDDVSDITSFLSLRKFASQGTATTFPVMSLVMLFIALGSSFGDDEKITMASLRRRRDRVRVFGDDIIIPTYGYSRLVRAMDLLQLKVNTAKSYVNGHFRESCGTDGYCGYDVTPTSPKTLVADSPASCQAVVDTSNNLFNKGLWNAAQSASDLIPAKVRKYLRVVGRNGAGPSGLTCFSGSYEHHLNRRWNHGLHRNEVRVWAIQAQSQKRLREDVTGLLDFFTRSPSLFNPRIVSITRDVRKTKARLVWEPENVDARISHTRGETRDVYRP